MSKEKLKNAIIETIKAWQDVDKSGEIDVDNGNVDRFIKDLMNDIDRDYKGVDINKLDIQIEKEISDHKMLKELGADNRMYVAGKITGLKKAKELLS